tara:strand:+ start:272 stop:406 length:135 start_codon:yes stop_codon:yes gene_type:complete
LKEVAIGSKAKDAADAAKTFFGWPSSPKEYAKVCNYDYPAKMAK